MSDGTAYALQRGIRAERSRKGMSQDELADRLGWSRSRLAAVESGTRPVRAHELPDLCGVLGVSLSVLLQMAPAEDLRRLGL
jgi:transcriptional regulator with XRE-family HTH domain